AARARTRRRQIKGYRPGELRPERCQTPRYRPASPTEVPRPRCPDRGARHLVTGRRVRPRGQTPPYPARGARHLVTGHLVTASLPSSESDRGARHLVTRHLGAETARPAGSSLRGGPEALSSAEQAVEMADHRERSDARSLGPEHEGSE